MLCRIKAAGNDKNYYCYPNLNFTFPLNPGGSDGKASACNAGDLGSIPGSGRSSGEGDGLPTAVLLPEKFHGQRSLVGYSPWGHKELDMTERLHFLLNESLVLGIFYMHSTTVCGAQKVLFSVNQKLQNNTLHQ